MLIPPDPIDRRRFLKTGLAGLGAAATAGAPARALAENPFQRRRAFDEESDANVFVFPRLKFKILTRVVGYWNAEPSADEILLNYVRKVTNVKISSKPWQERVIDIADLRKAYLEPDKPAEIYSRPFLFMTGEGNFHFEAPEAATLGEYLKRGGFLFADDCVYQGYGDHFFRAFLREGRKLLPGQELRPVPHDHEIYHCFYDFPRGAPFCQGQRHEAMGLFIDDRLVCFLTPGDIHCGWLFWQDHRTRESLKMGTNIIIYALTH